MKSLLKYSVLQRVKGILLLKQFFLTLLISAPAIICYAQSPDSIAKQKEIPSKNNPDDETVRPLFTLESSKGLTPSPLFDTTKSGDPYFPGGDIPGGEGRNDQVAWNYLTEITPLNGKKKYNFPDITIFNNSGLRGVEYYGYNQYGAYLRRDDNGKLNIYNGSEFIEPKNQVVPTNLYNSRAEFDIAQNYSEQKPQPKHVPEVPVITGANGHYFLKFKGGCDTATHLVLRPVVPRLTKDQIAQYYTQFENNTGPWIEKGSKGTAILYNLERDGTYTVKKLSADMAKLLLQNTSPVK